MTDLFRNRSRLLGGCASTALALALVLSPDRAAAQGIQADGTVVFGAAEIDQATPGTTFVEVGATTTVIDWQPTEDGSGNALDFLPNGATAIFQNTPGQGEFAVLNRILPSANGNIAVINGSVISRVLDANSLASPGGFIAFYSPTGLLIGGNATFDVGSLMLTTLDISDTDFQNFAQFSGNMTMSAAPGSTARISIAPGAQILASPENAFFAVVAADVEMRGTALVNGSHAYVAGEVVNLSFSNGLFNISVPVGTAASGEVVTVNGTVGGPSSAGFGDNHMIYGVAHASADPISMLFSGNLGFDPAQSAGVINGEIILAANYNVFGRFVAGGSISDGINATFQQTDGTTTTRADIGISDITASSSILAIGTHSVVADAFLTASSVAGNLLLVGRESASLNALDGQSFTITGDVLVDSRDYGVASSSLQSLDQINARGGDAIINAFAGAAVTINGSALVTADAFAGAEDISRIAGFALGGSAQVRGFGGVVRIDGNAEISARGVGTTRSGIEVGAESRGGLAQILATQGGSAIVGQDLIVLADAIAANGSLFSPSTVSNAYGGQALISIFDGGGTISVGGLADANASATGGSANTAGAGSIGDAGEAVISINGPGLMTLSNTARLIAEGRGGDNAGGIGGAGLGGRATAITFSGGTIGITGRFDAGANGIGGLGVDGGNGLGGIAGAIVTLGQITIGGLANAFTVGQGGNASYGFGGNGGIGRGGNSAFQATGSLTQTATLSITGRAAAQADGFGGFGGAADGSTIAAGRGGDGYGGQFAVPNQADPAFNSGAFILAGGDNGRITIGGESLVSAEGQGGIGGGAPSGFNGGRGGDGFGGLAQAGLALLGFDGSVGLGTATFADIFSRASGFGGQGGFSGLDFATGDGGNATGGFAALTVRAGDMTANRIELVANAFAGEGMVGGIGTGGAAAVIGSLGGVLTMDSFFASANGFGGPSGFATGGLGVGGEAGIELQGINVTVTGDTEILAIGSGGGVNTGTAGNGIGGTAFVAVTDGFSGRGTFLGNTSIVANGFGGSAGDASVGGDGTGGLAYVQAQSASRVQFGTLQVTASGRGGDNENLQALFVGGTGTGGSAELRSLGSDSSIIVERNFDGSLYSNEMNNGGMVAAIGIGGLTTGGTGVGGQGRGGSILLRAALGGEMFLPANPLTDPGSNGPIRLLARGFGGGSLVDGGSGGQGRGGTGVIEVDGGSMAMGATLFSVFSQGGSSLEPTLNIAGGDAFGGTRRIRVLNGGSLTYEFGGGVTGGAGGNGSGNSDGGDGYGGLNSVEVIGATLNIVGNFVVADESRGGTGHIGGDAFQSGEGGGVSFVADQATINFSPDASGQSGLLMGGTNFGGNGDVRGGNATGTPVSVTINNSTFNSGNLQIIASALGGSGLGAGANGGNATGVAVSVNISGSNIGLIGENIIALDVQGGAGASDALGGTATGGQVNVLVTSSTIDIATNAVGIPGVLRVRSQATGGVAGTIGNAISGRAFLGLADTVVSAAQLYVESRALSEASSAGQVGGSAIADQARLELSGATEIDTDLIALTSEGRTSLGGSSQGGTAGLEVISGSTVSVTTGALNLTANGSGADPANRVNGAGQFFVNVGGGNVSVGTLAASALGDVINGNPPASQLVAEGGNLNVSNQIAVSTYGNLLIRTFGGSIIGAPAVAATTTQIDMVAQGTIQVLGDNNPTGGLSGQSINLSAGRSILLDGSLSATNGVLLTANAGNGQPLPVNQGGPAVIAMANGTSINAGTGSVGIRLLDGGSDPDRATASITLASITASSLSARNFGSTAGSDIRVLASGVLTASGAERAIDLASLNGEVVNLAGDAGLVLTGTGHYAIFAATPTGSQIGSFANYLRRYNVPNAAAYDALDPGGNFAAFRIVPVLTVTADNITRFYGNLTPGLTATFAGFLPGDSIADLLGAPDLTTIANGTSGVGLYAINAALGTLLSEQGYQFSFNPGQLTITPRPITVTANNLSRIYGNANPALTFTVGGQGLVNGDQLGGALATAANSTSGVGTFAITQGSLVAGANYALTFVDGLLTITPRALTVTANNLSRIYGNANPALTFTVGGLGLVNGDQLTGALSTAANVTTGVGTFAITQGTLAASANYALTFVNGGLTITPRPITITADNLSKIYGNANPALTFTVGGLGLVNGDQLTGALATTANATTGVGTAAITQGTLAASANYTVNFLGASMSITPRPITVTADNLSRIYGNANPALTFTVGGLGLVNGDQLSGALATTANATTGVGTAAITQGTLAASANYSFTFVNGQLTITPRPITVTANNLSRIYGNANPALTFTVGGQGLVNGDQLGGALATAANSTSGVGTFAITQGSLVAGANYALTFVDGLLTITPRALTVTANNLSRIYGNANPALTFTVGGLGLVNGDQLTGALSTAANVTTGVGTFAITQGTLAASANYALTFVNGGLTITPRPITITADNLSKIYGNANPALTFTVGGLGLVNGDQLTGALATTANATTGVGTAAITQGTLAASANYTVNFLAASMSITPRPITVTADNLSRIYGNANPALTFTVGGLGLVNGDQLSGALATTANATTGVGTAAITQGTLAASANYSFTFVNGQLTITPRPITVTANNLSRIYGNANPALTFTVGGQGLVNGDQLTGALATTANATTGVGTVAITQGTLAASANYSFTFVNGALTITPRPITITADNYSKFAGQPDPVFTFQVGGDGLVNNDRLTGNLARESGEAIRTFAITIGSLAAGPNYAVTFVAGELEINAPPAPPEVNNPTSLEPALTPTDPMPTAEEEEEARFGMDFPSQPDAPLIEEDELLDDPVTSGGDPSLYSSGITPPAGSQ